MAQTKRLLPLAAMEKIMKNAGENIGVDRVSEKAKIALKKVLEDIAEDIASNAVRLTKHARRTTVKEKDIKLAASK